MEQPANNFETLAPRRKSARRLIWIILIILIGLAGWWFLGGRSKFGSLAGMGDGYQAVFLTNNQVYFGKLMGSRGNYAVLTDIFYLQVGQPLQPSQPNPNVNLVKLGSELHGPDDRMEINRDHILFVESLKADSQVVKAIKQYYEQQKSQEPK